MSLLLACLVAAVVVALFEAWCIALSACQWFLSRRPLLGRRVTPTCSLPGEGGHDGSQAAQSRRYATSHGRSLSSPPPASSSADRESAVGLLPLSFSLGAIDPSPDLSAFGAGVELIVFVVLFTISTFVVLNWVLKTMRSSK
jgi:hypothetical protein